MVLIMEDILQFPSLKEAKLMNEKCTLNSPVTGAMVMEALDIEEWGSSGQVLLTSYFAFKDTDDKTIDLFFSQAKEIGIAGFIFKTNRLINEIPDYFLSRCRKYQFPLIQVQKDITYSEIINEILESIINQNAFLLKNYYDNHQKFTQLMMSQADIIQILDSLKTLIQLPVSLIENVEEEITGTDEEYHHFNINAKEPVVQKTNMHLAYQQISVHYTHDSINKQNMLSVAIPNLGYEEYELLIHEGEQSLSAVQLMAVENAVVALQTELVKRYALRQNNHSHLNEMATDLIHGRLSDSQDVKDTIHNLKLDSSKNYRVVIFNFDHHIKDYTSSGLSRFTDALVNLSKNQFHDIVYVTQQRKIILIVAIDDLTMNDIKDKINIILKQLSHNALYEKVISQTTISNEVSVYALSDGYSQSMDTQKIGQLLIQESPVLSYEEIGIYQLFIETDNTDTIKKFVPDKIWRLQKRNSDLLDTLYTFINVNQNYSEASKQLFVHPKTVRYRVDQLKEQYGIDFENADDMLRYNIALRIVKYLE